MAVIHHPIRTVAVPSPQAAAKLLEYAETHGLAGGRHHTISFLTGIADGSIPPAVPVLLTIPSAAAQEAIDAYLATEWPAYVAPVFTQEQLLALPLEALNLGARPHNSLYRDGIGNLGDIMNGGECRLRDIPQVKDVYVEQIRGKLALYGLVLGD